MSVLGAELIDAFAGHAIITIELHAYAEKLVFVLDDGTKVSITGAGNDCDNYLEIEVVKP